MGILMHQVLQNHGSTRTVSWLIKKAVNDKNEMLLKQAIEMVEFDISLIKSLRQAPETANYNKNAYNTGTLLGNSGFDFKQ